MTRRARDRGTDPESGTSIPEVLVATMLLAVGVGAVLATLGTAGGAAATGEHHSTATALADGDLEQLRALVYAEVGIATTDPDHQPEFEGRDTVSGAVNRVDPLDQVTVDGIDYTVRRHVTWAPVAVGGTTTPRGYKHLTVIVTWADAGGDHRLRLDSGRYEVDGG